MNLASMGYLYQWGHNVSFTYGATGDVLGVACLFSEWYYTGIHKDKFITNGNDPYDWLSPQDYTLCSGANDQAVCPNGWRLPTDTELTVLKDKYDANKNLAANRISIAGDVATETLYLPATGRRLYTNGTSFRLG